MPINMTSDDYHSHPAISNSNRAAARQSGRHYFDQKEGPPRASTAPFNLGTLLHATALPGENVDQIAVRMPEGLKKTTKEGKAFISTNEGKIIVNAADAFAIDQMMLSMLEHPFSASLIKGDLPGKSEQSFFAVDPETELELKCRPDFILDDYSWIIDLKSTLDASPKGFQRSLTNYRYFVQAAWYLDVVEMETGRRPEAFVFVAVEKQRPFNVGVYCADEQMIQVGKQHAREDLMNIAKWKNTGVYPGYSNRAEMISLPKWMLPKDDGSSNTDYQPIELY